MVVKEPINLREWKPLGGKPELGSLFTCGRPGRGTFDTARTAVDEATIDRWVQGLPQVNLLHIISLLGRKRDGFSEFWYYPFKSCAESGAKPTFQEWLDDRYGP